MCFETLEDWLRWQEGLHPRAVDLGLDRCRLVASRLGLPGAGFIVFTVAGTNGKGSTVAFLEAILEAAGQRTGAYTSPHLLRYNERVRVGGRPVDDRTLCEAFARVERARGDTSLTYFEFGTLAAMDVFRGAALDAVVLEVGLGGRLDAVNVFDPDVAVITAVDLDHMDWLGPDRESIGREKAGVLRGGRPAVCADPDPPRSVLATALTLGARLQIAGRDFHGVVRGATWDWHSGDRVERGLPNPALPGAFQVQNAAGAIAALAALGDRLPVTRAAIDRGLSEARLPGRLQVLGGSVERILDVAHNPQAVRALAGFLAGRPGSGRTHALIGMLADKDCRGVVREAAGVVDAWHTVSLPGPRGLDAGTLADALVEAGVPADRVHPRGEAAQAYVAVLGSVLPPDRIVVFGSFLTVAAALRVESARAGAAALLG